MTEPAPGSRVHAAAAALEAATPNADHVAAHQAELAAQVPAMGPVPVQPVTPDSARYRTMVLAASDARLLLPQDPSRRLAQVLALDNDVVICTSKELAQNSDNQASGVPFPRGFYLPKGTILPVYNQAALYVANTSTSATTRVSIAVEADENPSPFGQR